MTAYSEQPRCPLKFTPAQDLRFAALTTTLVLLCAAAQPAQAQPAPVQSPQAQSGQVQPAAQADAVAKAFHDFCLKPAQTMAAMADAASHMGALKQADKFVPLGENRSLHQETWLAPVGRVPAQLTALDGDAAAGPNRALGCSITISGVDGMAVSQALTMGAALGAPDKRVAADAQHGASAVWERNFRGNNGRILLSYGAPDSEMVSLHLILPNIPR